jgi:hypothetical protein
MDNHKAKPKKKRKVSSSKKAQPKPAKRARKHKHKHDDPTEMLNKMFAQAVKKGVKEHKERQRFGELPDLWDIQPITPFTPTFYVAGLPCRAQLVRASSRPQPQQPWTPPDFFFGALHRPESLCIYACVCLFISCYCCCRKSARTRAASPGTCRLYRDFRQREDDRGLPSVHGSAQVQGPSAYPWRLSAQSVRDVFTAMASCQP